MSRWSRDPTTHGAYSAPGVGVDEHTYLHLKAPVNKTLWFGGEAATDSEDYGYAHGAFRGGTHQATQLVKCIKDASVCPKYKPRPPPCPKANTNSRAHSLSSASAFTMMALLVSLCLV